MNYAIILAAGMGTRMKSDTPKCAIKLLDKPMITYLLDSLSKSQIDETICVLGHKKEVFFDIINNKALYAIQDKQLGTAHAVLCTKELVSDKEGITIIMPGDTPLIDEDIINDLINTHYSNNNTLTVTTVKVDNPYGYGRIIKENDNVIRIVEEKDATSSEKQIKEINAGLYCINNNVLFEALEKISNNNAKKEYYLTDIVEIISKTGKVGSYISNEVYKLTGINDLYHLSEVEACLRKAINKKHMLNGVYMENSDTITIGPDVYIESNTKILQGSKILGNSIIKNGSVIGPNSSIYNSTIDENSNVIESVIADSTVGKFTNIGPYSHVRLNSIIGDNNRIGNFVEVKNSTIGNNTNASHLTYIGDTICGSGVNFGCGTVTVNYDGENKNKTIIGDNVFIGCNSNLVAPITIKSNSFIAAGSTITDGLESGDFAIARAKQITKHNYSYKYKFIKK